MKAQTLKPEFYQRDTVAVARELLGKKLVHRMSDGRILSGLIVEVEAYIGEEDPACHGYGRRYTERTSTLYLAGGHAYVYFIYGMHFCFNVVTSQAGHPEAVLVRAVEPVEGIQWMKEARNISSRSPYDLTNGPGKLCQALGIDRRHNAKSLIDSELTIEEGIEFPDSEVNCTARVGIEYAGDAAYWPLRFLIKNNPFVSKARLP